MGNFRDDTAISKNLIENIIIKVDKIAQELDLAKPRLLANGKNFLKK